MLSPIKEFVKDKLDPDCHAEHLERCAGSILIKSFRHNPELESKTDKEVWQYYFDQYESEHLIQEEPVIQEDPKPLKKLTPRGVLDDVLGYLGLGDEVNTWLKTTYRRKVGKMRSTRALLDAKTSISLTKSSE